MDKLDHLIALRQLMSEPRSEGREVSGWLIMDQRVGELLDALSDEVTTTVDGKPAAVHKLKAGQKVSVRFDGSPLNYYEGFAEFLAHFPDRVPAKRFHIHQLAFTSGSGAPPAQIERYEQAVGLWRLLTAISDHADGRRVFILSSDKLEIECAYGEADLNTLEKLRQLEADFAEGSASFEEKRTIFKRALQQELKGCKPSERFGMLLRSFQPVHDRYWQNFRLFLEGISFDKIFEGYVEKHAKLITELNSVLGGIQTALIGLPIASFVILEKMTVADHISFKNTLLLLGCLVFVSFLAVLSISQGRTLRASKELARELNEEISRKSPDLATKLRASMGRLERHVFWVKWLLYTVRCLLLGLASATVATFVYVSFPTIKDWGNACLRRITEGSDADLNRLNAAVQDGGSPSERLEHRRALVAYWEKRLAAAELKIYRELDPASADSFRKACAAWRDFRNAQAAAESESAGNGQSKALVYESIIERLTVERAHWTERHYESTYGRQP